jgi:hypothetical protein
MSKKQKLLEKYLAKKKKQQLRDDLIKQIAELERAESCETRTIVEKENKKKRNTRKLRSMKRRSMQPI